jgi:hypothetical protein
LKSADTRALSPVRTRADPITCCLLVVPMVAGVFLSRFAFSFFNRELSLPLLLIGASLAGLAAFGRLRVHVPRLILFAISIAAMMAATALGGAGRVSAMSFLLLAALYLSYVFVADGDEATYAWTIRAFRLICLIAAVAGIAQFAAQFVIRGPTLFTFRGYVPDSYLALEYNYVDPVEYLPGFYKSNGFFLPEPSIFSQLMALAAVVELLFFRFSYRLLVIGAALFVSFSGTGAILCIVFGSLLLLRRGNLVPLLLAAGLAVAVLLLGDDRILQPFIGRIGEFGSTYSSGFARFLSPFYLFNDFLFTNTRNMLFGLGPGAINTFFNNFYTEVHDPTWGKLFLEYGLIGSLPFGVFITCCFFADSPAKWLSGALFFNYLLLGGYLLSPPVAGLVLPLVVWQRAARFRPAPRRQPLVYPVAPDGRPA